MYGAIFFSASCLCVVSSILDHLLLHLHFSSNRSARQAGGACILQVLCCGCRPLAQILLAIILDVVSPR
jgi:hypothetical protein